MPGFKPLVSRNAVLKQSLEPPEDIVPIVAVTAPWPQILIPDAVTSIPKTVPFTTFGSLANCIAVAVLPEGVGVAAVGDALGDGVIVGEVVAVLVVVEVLVTDVVVDAFVLVPELDA
ncbi:MAG: hypothetical protein ACXV5H_02245 [Halobacteriota archaeon]